MTYGELMTLVAVADVSRVMEEHGLRNPVLPFLARDSDFMRILLFQPRATIVADDDGVRSQHRERMTAQMTAFISRAKELNVDLAACPEYSCTWEAILQAAENGTLPSPGKVWAIACESATREEFETTRARIGNRMRIVIDDGVLDANGNFIDPLCYLFSTELADGSTANVALVQAKTHQMGGDDYERSYLKKGNTIYRFKNDDESSNSLVSIICSDALNASVTDRMRELHGQNCLVLHLQLNKRPEAPAFRAYREHCCTIAPRTTEILCLNWAAGTTLLTDAGEVPLVAEPRTILFRAITEVNAGDDRITHNHGKGCYLTYLQQHRTAAFVFCPDPRLLYLETTKPVTGGPAQNALRSGPRMIDIFGWDDDTDTWNALATGADDRFKTSWLDPHAPIQTLLNPILPEHLNAERLVQLCVGKATSMDWAQWTRLRSFELADDDTARRLTLCWSHEGSGHQYRDECLRLFRIFATTVADSSNFSPRLTEFKNDTFQVAYRTQTSKTFRNLHLPNGTSATAVYLGTVPSRGELDEAKKRLISGLQQTESDTELVAIWFHDQNLQLRDFMDMQTPRVNDDPGENPVSITSTAP